MSDRDPRLGLPSASIMHAVAECSGRMALVNALRAEQKLSDHDKASPEALSGRRIHELIATRREVDLMNDEEVEIAEECVKLERALVREWAGDATDTFFELREERFYYRQFDEILFSGQPDLCVLDFRNLRALIINYKTGRKAADDAADNLQLRTEVVLLKDQYKELQTIDAAIVEPRVDWHPVRVQYSLEDMHNAELQIVEICEHATLFTDRRKAGNWCTYCPARVVCPEAQAVVTSISAYQGVTLTLPRGVAGTEFFEKVKLAKKLVEQIEKAYDKILDDEPDALPGYHKKGSKHWVIASPRKLKDALGGLLTEDEIDGCATFWINKLREVFGLKFRLKGNELDKQFYGALSEGAKRVLGAPYIRPLSKFEKARLLNEQNEINEDE